MKMPPAKYEEIKEGIRAVVDHHGKANVQSLCRGKSVTYMMFGLFAAMWFDFQYEDTHPAYAAGRIRILPHKDQGWLHKLYDSGLNDDHIETALKKVARELGLAPDPA